MEGTLNMIKNYAPYLYKNYETMYNQNVSKNKPAKKNSLIKRPTESMVTDLNNPKELMQDYFASVKAMREKFNDPA